MFLLYFRFSHWLCKHAAMTLDRLMAGFEKCYTPTPTSIRTTTVFNITEWLIPHLNTIKNHSKPHIFKITKDDNGRARIYWKEWSTDRVRTVQLGLLTNVSSFFCQFTFYRKHTPHTPSLSFFFSLSYTRTQAHTQLTENNLILVVSRHLIG